MKQFRHWLVKNFVLDYQLTLFNTTYNAPRASRIIFPLFVITGTLNCFNDDWPTPTPLIWCLYFLVALSLYFGFMYFKYFPVTWLELDDWQKYQYGALKPDKLTKEQYLEWLDICEEIIKNQN